MVSCSFCANEKYLNWPWPVPVFLSFIVLKLKLHYDENIDAYVVELSVTFEFPR